jgi:hypothetical protein
LGLEKAKSVNVYRFEKQLTRGSGISLESSTIVRDFELEPEVVAMVLFGGTKNSNYGENSENP